MQYVKPQLNGYQAIRLIQDLTNKMSDDFEPDQVRVTDPAYQADE